MIQHLLYAEGYENDYVHLVTSEKVHPHPPTSFTPPRGPNGANNNQNASIPVHYTHGFVLPSYPGLTVSCDLTFKTLRLLFPRKNRKFDLCHASTPGFLLFWAILASQLYQIPLVMSYHTHLPVYARSYFPAPWNRLFEWLAWVGLRIAHSMADLTLVTSPQLAEEFRAHRIPRCHVWPKGIDTARFHPKYKSDGMRFRMTNGHPEDFLLVYIGRLAREKRLRDLKAVLEKINTNSSISTRLCIIGSGPEEESLKEFFKGTPTTFLGRLDGLELSQAFASANVFCMPSDSETLGFVVLESMASGVCCVAARAGGLVDLIHHSKTGFLVPTGDIDAFCKHIKELQNNPDYCQEMSLAGRKEMERWSWESSMSHVVDLYQLALDNFSRRPAQRLFRCFRSSRSSKASVE